MCAENQKNKPGYWRSLFHHKCSRCRTGDMFKVRSSYNLRQFMKMYDKCPVCDQDLEIEVGFYYGTSYISYAITVALSAVTCLAWWVSIGFSLNDGRFFWWMGCNIVALVIAQPWLMRFSRAIWLSFFVRYNENWQVERPADPERKGSRKPD